MRGLSLHVQEVHRHSRCGGPPPVASSHGSVAAPWRSANPWLVAGRSAWRSASSASFPRDRQVVHDRRWPVAAEPRPLIHLAAAVIDVFRSRVGVALAHRSHGRSVFAKSRTDLHKCQASPEICQVSNNAKPICKTIGEVFLWISAKIKNAKAICKTVGDALIVHFGFT